MLVGDNFGQITLLDVQRKVAVDRCKLPDFEGRRILSLSSCTFTWVGTQVTYVAAVARGSAKAHILAFNHKDCKLKSFMHFNLMPDLQNPSEPELNPDQKYTYFPSTVKLSMDAAFLAVTLAEGTVKLFSLPPIPNPLPAEAFGSAAEAGGLAEKSKESASRKTPSHPAGTDKQSSSMSAGQKTTETETVEVRTDFDSFKLGELSLEAYLIQNIKARKPREFVDPFPFAESMNDTSQESVGTHPLSPKSAKAPPHPDLLLGSKRF